MTADSEEQTTDSRQQKYSEGLATNAYRAVGFSPRADREMKEQRP